MFKRVYQAEVTIPASTKEVWEVLRDFDSYHLWNPFTPKSEVEPTHGGNVRQEVILNDPHRPTIHKARVSGWIEGEMMSWEMAMRPLLRAERKQWLIADGEYTIYKTADLNQGIIVPLVHALYGKSIERGFSQLANALRDRVVEIKQLSTNEEPG